MTALVVCRNGGPDDLAAAIESPGARRVILAFSSQPDYVLVAKARQVEWDNYYIQNWSLRFDLRIVALTIAEVFRFRG